MKGFHAAIDGHVVNILPPVDINGGVSSDVIDMGKHGHVTFIIQAGVTAAATTLKVQACDDFVPTTPTDMAFTIYKEETAAEDTLGAAVAVAAAGVALSANNSIFYVVELDAAELAAGFEKVRLNFSDPSGVTFYSAVAILSGSRYGKEQSGTVIA